MSIFMVYLPNNSSHFSESIFITKIHFAGLIDIRTFAVVVIYITVLHHPFIGYHRKVDKVCVWVIPGGAADGTFAAAYR
jgi:hypothetical protein